MCEKSAIDAIKIARIILLSHKDQYVEMVAKADSMVAMAALLFLEATEKDSLVEVHMP